MPSRPRNSPLFHSLPLLGGMDLSEAFAGLLLGMWWPRESRSIHRPGLALWRIPNLLFYLPVVQGTIGDITMLSTEESAKIWPSLSPAAKEKILGSPAPPPSPGVVPRLKNPPTQNALGNASVGICLGVSTLFVVLPLCTRIRQSTKLHIEDCKDPTLLVKASSSDSDRSHAHCVGMDSSSLLGQHKPATQLSSSRELSPA
jgi:hypothetical protein